jgi:N-ethylmaleimide reductase
MSLPLRTEKQPMLGPYDLGAGLRLRNRVVMARMTRARADNPSPTPTESHSEYYRQRAGAGLIVSEGTWISTEAVGAVNVPGMYGLKQARAWRPVTSAVHAEGGAIFAQLAHTGAASHPVTPGALGTGRIAGVVEQYRSAASNARLAGFDGVELDAQRGCLIAQFPDPALNPRTDAYGSTAEGRARLLFAVLDAVVGVWGPHRVGVKLAPHQVLGESNEASPEALAVHEHVAARLNDYPLAYLHVMTARRPDARVTEAQRRESLGLFRPLYRGTLIANASLDQESGNAVVSDGLADLVSFAALFISNPDLPQRFEQLIST